MVWRRFRNVWKDWILHKKIYLLIGLGGVSENESKLPRVWGRFFSYFVVVISILLLLQWQWELLGELSEQRMLLYNWIIWSYFAIQYFTLIILVKDKTRYIKYNWLLPIIILIGTLFLIRYQPLMVFLNNLRPVLAIIILVPSISLLLQFFLDGKLRTTLLASAIIVIIFGVLASGVDPNIKTAWDGIWWAVATVTTIGYGDVVPSSELGRLLGIGLMILGLGLFVIITANFLALTLIKETKKIKEEEKKLDNLYNDVQDMKQSQKEILSQLKTIKKELMK